MTSNDPLWDEIQNCKVSKFEPVDATQAANARRWRPLCEAGSIGQICPFHRAEVRRRASAPFHVRGSALIHRAPRNVESGKRGGATQAPECYQFSG